MIGDALRPIRVFHDVSQKDLAAQFEISASHLSEIESSKKQPSLYLLEKYAEEYKIPVSSIMFFSEKLEQETKSEKLRFNVSEKVLSLLNFIAVRSGREAA